MPGEEGISTFRFRGARVTGRTPDNRPITREITERTSFNKNFCWLPFACWASTSHESSMIPTGREMVDEFTEFDNGRYAARVDSRTFGPLAHRADPTLRTRLEGVPGGVENADVNVFIDDEQFGVNAMNRRRDDATVNYRVSAATTGLAVGAVVGVVAAVAIANCWNPVGWTLGAGLIVVGACAVAGTVIGLLCGW